ncbi:MAG: hypothetical protein ACRD3A_10770, partial [Terriglobales bacterium]
MLLFVLLIFCSALSALPPGDNAPAAPKAYHAKTYPAHEAHEMEKLSIAADPYDMADKAAVFVTPFLNEGILPVHHILSNDGKQPVT